MTKAKQTTFTRIPTRQCVKVLYQNLGGTWYAFADVSGEIYFTPLHFIQNRTTPEVSFYEEDFLEAEAEAEASTASQKSA